MLNPGPTLPVLVRRTEWLCERVMRFDLAAMDGAALPAWEPGAHLDVEIAPGLVRQYSICNVPGEAHYCLAVQREDGGRGGSLAMHRVRAGDVVRVSRPRNLFRLQPDGDALLVAGGIGLTPILCMARALARASRPFELHVCTRSAEATPFLEEIRALAGAGTVRLVHDGGDRARGLDAAALLHDMRPGTHVYCCGPGGLMDAVAQAASHWPQGTVHFESFRPAAAAHGAAGAFRVRLRSSGLEIEVPAQATLLEALRASGVDVASSCEQGLCGTCEIGLVSGSADHRDCVLTSEQRAANRSLMPCVSRAQEGELLVLDL